MLEPRHHHLAQAVAVEAVEAAPPLAPDLDQAGLFQHAEVARGGGPAVLETGGEVPRGKLATEVAQDEDHVAPGLVRQRGEDRLGVFEGYLAHGVVA